MLNKASSWQTGQWLDDLVGQPSWAALAHSEPTESDPLSVEVNGPGYRRQRISWTRSGRSARNTTDLKFSGLSTPVGLVGVMVFTSENGSVLRASGLLPVAMTLYDASSYVIGAGEMVFYIS